MLGFSGTFCEPYGGLTAVATGAAVCGSTAIRNELWYELSALPCRSCALPSRMPLANNANVLLLTVAGFSDSENVTTTCALRPTSPDPSAGVTLATSGGVVSATAAVTKEADANPFELPIRSWTPVTCTEM